MFDEAEFFRAIHESGARSLLMGRRALIALGIPVLTADYDFWVHIDDIATFNGAAEPFDLTPTHSPAEARQRGRYVLENTERVDVLCARGVPTITGERIVFEEIWPRRLVIDDGRGVPIALPSIDDLIATKRFAARAKDAEDVRLLQVLRSKYGDPGRGPDDSGTA